MKNSYFKAGINYKDFWYPIQENWIIFEVISRTLKTQLGTLILMNAYLSELMFCTYNPLWAGCQKSYLNGGACLPMVLRGSP